MADAKKETAQLSTTQEQTSLADFCAQLDDYTPTVSNELIIINY